MSNMPTQCVKQHGMFRKNTTEWLTLNFNSKVLETKLFNKCDKNHNTVVSFLIPNHSWCVAISSNPESIEAEGKLSNAVVESLFPTRPHGRGCVRKKKSKEWSAICRLSMLGMLGTFLAPVYKLFHDVVFQVKEMVAVKRAETNRGHTHFPSFPFYLSSYKAFLRASQA